MISTILAACALLYAGVAAYLWTVDAAAGGGTSLTVGASIFTGGAIGAGMLAWWVA